MSAPERPAAAGRTQLLTLLRRAVVATVTASAAVPQFDMDVVLDVTALEPLRRELGCGRESGLTDLLVAALGRMLPAHPLVNGSFRGDHLVLHDHVDVAVLVEFERTRGHRTDVGRRDGRAGRARRRRSDRAGALAAERRRLAAAVAGRALRPGDVVDATVTLSNLGPSGMQRFRALIVPPQAAVLAVGGRTADSAGVTATLSCDHRIVGGGPAARFLADLAATVRDVDKLFAPAAASATVGASS